MIKVGGYLTQQKLGAFLSSLGVQNIVTEQRVGTTRCRFDFVGTLNGAAIAVEFDGDLHYRDSLVIRRDIIKTEFAKNQNIRLIRIPYWVQPSKETILHYFGVEAEVEQTYPHGFIDSKIFPASFCELGELRFLKEMTALPRSTKEEVIKSLKSAAKKYGKEFVLPYALYDLIG